MMKKPAGKLHMDGLLALLLLGLFAVCILSVLLTGADAYQRLTAQGQASYERRTATQYLATRVRQADARGALSVGNFSGADTLEVMEEIGGDTYLTRIYCYGGSLRELFSAREDTFAPEDGEEVFPAQSMNLLMYENFLTISLLDEDGKPTVLHLALRSEEEGTP